MDNAIKKLFADILNCVNKIESFVGTNRTFIAYDTDLLLQDAVERNFITIGEAMNALLKKEPAIPISNARKVVDARNKLTHGYDEIDNQQIWNIIINYLPILRSEVEALLNEN